MDQPTTRQLAYFVSVAEELHFGRAAERCGIAQPPLTEQIQKLEATLGCKLIDRARPIKLTPAGAEYFVHARRLLEQGERAVEAARRAARGQTGRLAIGVPPSVLLSNLPTAIRKYRLRFPDVEFTLRELSTSAIESAVRNEEIDLGFLRESNPEPPLGSSLVFEEGIVAVLPSRHPLRLRRALTLGMLKHEPFVMFPRRLGPGLYDKLTSACAAAGFHPNVAHEAIQWPSVIAFVEAGAGVALAPECLAKLRLKGVVYRVLPKLSTTVRACWLGDQPPPTASAFLQFATSS